MLGLHFDSLGPGVMYWLHPPLIGPRGHFEKTAVYLLIAAGIRRKETKNVFY